jgi:hypothetical protein
MFALRLAAKRAFGESFGAEIRHHWLLQQLPSTPPAKPAFFMWTSDSSAHNQQYEDKGTDLSKRNKIGAQANPTAVPPVGFQPLSLYILVKIAVPAVCLHQSPNSRGDRYRLT